MNCSNCGTDFQGNFCPKCGTPAPGNADIPGKKKKKKFHWWYILIALLVIIIIGSIGAEDNGPQKVGESDVQEDQEPVSEVFKVGDIVELDGVSVTLLDVSESDGSTILVPADGNTFVLFEFDISNQSDEEISVSSMLSFDVYFDDYSSNLSITATSSSDKPQLDGTIAPGKKMTGIVGYEAPDDWAKAEVRFTPSFWDGEEIIFEYEK